MIDQDLHGLTVLVGGHFQQLLESLDGGIQDRDHLLERLSPGKLGVGVHGGVERPVAFGGGPLRIRVEQGQQPLAGRFLKFREDLPLSALAGVFGGLGDAFEERLAPLLTLPCKQDAVAILVRCVAHRCRSLFRAVVRRSD